MSEGPKSHVLAALASHVFYFLGGDEIADGGFNAREILLKLLSCRASNHTLLKMRRPTMSPNTYEAGVGTRDGSPARRRANSRSHL